jgi:eukaryotic-like serine/threonine-protein kinase
MWEYWMPDPLPRLVAALSDRYRIERELGQGGMATVYLAQDLKHDRKVALKVLKPELAAVIGAERFLVEIKTTAALQHPHILPLFDSGTADGYIFYVMPFVEGETLRDRLNQERQLPVADAARIATEVAAALDYAHRHDIIHRDIKPENILLHDGSAVVADFGIALAASSVGSARLTETGLSLGSPLYMSPEQAMGERNITVRSDVYALGCVLYEMLTGEPPYTGATPQSITARKLSQPLSSIRSVRETVPVAVEQVVGKALARLPADRFGSCREFADALAASLTSDPTLAGSARPTRARFHRLWWVLGALLAGCVVVIVMQMQRRSATLTIGRRAAIAVSPGMELSPSISPDGSLVSYTLQTSATKQLYTQQVNGGAPVPVVTQLPAGAEKGVFSPDGNRLLFQRPDGLYVVPALGGQARLVVPGRPNRRTPWGNWSPDGTRIVYGQDGAVYTQTLDGADRTKLTEGGEFYSFAWSPDGVWIAFVSGNPDFHDGGNVAPSGLRLIRAAGGPVMALTDSLSLNTSPVWVPGSRSLLYISDRDGGRDIYQLFLSRSGAPAGPPTRLTTGLDPEHISLSADGERLAWSTLARTSNVWSLPIPARDTIVLSEARQETVETQFIENIALSPDGRWLYFDSNRNGNQDIWRKSLADGQPEVLTTDPADDFQPAVSPDGLEVAFHSMRTGNRDIFVIPATGGFGTQVTTSENQDRTVTWSDDGRALAWTSTTDSTMAPWTARRDSSGAWGAPAPLPIGNVYGGGWSPDGRWFLYADAGGSTLWSPTTHERRRLVRDVFTLPYVWSAESRTVYGIASDLQTQRKRLIAIDVATGKVRVFASADTPWVQSVNGFTEGGGRFYFVLPVVQADIWVGEVATQ